jgi:hypothetical protein
MITGKRTAPGPEFFVGWNISAGPKHRPSRARTCGRIPRRRDAAARHSRHGLLEHVREDRVYLQVHSRIPIFGTKLRSLIREVPQPNSVWERGSPPATGLASPSELWVAFASSPTLTATPTPVPLPNLRDAGRRGRQPADLERPTMAETANGQ